jgi:DNA-binding response OmpR family regulator
MPGNATTRGNNGLLIYLVDDEEALLHLAEIALVDDGYSMKKFVDPEAAFASFTLEPQKPSLLLTDFAMGSMNGIELSARCKLAHPSLKILMVSGTVGPEVVQGAPVAIDQFLPKPYAPAELARTVRSLLGPDVV